IDSIGSSGLQGHAFDFATSAGPNYGPVKLMASSVLCTGITGSGNSPGCIVVDATLATADVTLDLFRTTFSNDYTGIRIMGLGTANPADGFTAKTTGRCLLCDQMVSGANSDCVFIDTAGQGEAETSWDVQYSGTDDEDIGTNIANIGGTQRATVAAAQAVITNGPFFTNGVEIGGGADGNSFVVGGTILSKCNQGQTCYAACSQEWARSFPAAAGTTEAVYIPTFVLGAKVVGVDLNRARNANLGAR
ncbi:MAG: hypothetical protein ACREQL_04320, partial [Candidatus Binatia bacterium]